MSPRRDDERLADIVDAIAAIRSHLARGDLSDGLVFDVVRVRLIEIGEAVKLLNRSYTLRDSEYRSVGGPDEPWATWRASLPVGAMVSPPPLRECLVRPCGGCLLRVLGSGCLVLSRDEVPEVVRAMIVTTCSSDPVPAFVAVLQRLVSSGVSLGDILADSGYAHRIPNNWAIPLRMLGANIVTDLHPADRGKAGTFAGARCFNANLYCPATPEALFEVEPLSRSASSEEIEDHDKKTAELARFKLGRLSADDPDGYHRVGCPALANKIRCPLRADSIALSFDRPEVLSTPKHPPTCCMQASVTVPPAVNAKTRQKHDYPSRAHRISYGRRTAVERSNARIKDPATVDVSRGWCRVMGLVVMSLFLVCGLVVRNIAVIDAFEERQEENARRAQLGKPLRTRKRRRKTLTDLAGANAPP